MPRVIELVNAPPAITWGIMEPVALALLTAGAMTILLASGLILAGQGKSARRLLSLSGIAATMTGLGALTLSLGNPIHIYLFLVSPAFSSWTTIGTFLLPVFLVVSLIVLYLDGTDSGTRRLAAAFAALLAVGVLTYTSREIGYLQGRVLWHWKLLPLTFVCAGAAGGTGVAAMLGTLRREGLPSWLFMVMASACLLCSGATILFAPPPGFVLSAETVWNVLSWFGVIGGVLALVAIRVEGLALAAGLAGYVTGVAFYAKLIFLGQAIPRNSFTSVDADAAARLISAPSAMVFIGSVAVMLGLGMLLAGLFDNTTLERREHSHG